MALIIFQPDLYTHTHTCLGSGLLSSLLLPHVPGLIHSDPDWLELFILLLNDYKHCSSFPVNFLDFGFYSTCLAIEGKEKFTWQVCSLL